MITSVLNAMLEKHGSTFIFNLINHHILSPSNNNAGKVRHAFADKKDGNKSICVQAQLRKLSHHVKTMYLKMMFQKTIKFIYTMLL